MKHLPLFFLLTSCTATEPTSTDNYWANQYILLWAVLMGGVGIGFLLQNGSDGWQGFAGLVLIIKTLIVVGLVVRYALMGAGVL